MLFTCATTVVPNTEGAPHAPGGEYPDCAELPPLTMHMLPGLLGDNMRNKVQVVWDQLSPRSVPEDDEYHETDGDLKEGELEEGED